MLILTATGCFVFFLATLTVLAAPWSLLCSRFQISNPTHALLLPGFGCLSLGLLVTFSVAAGLSNQLMQIVLLLSIAGSSYVLIKHRLYRLWCDVSLPLLILLWLYFLFCVSAAAFPSGQTAGVTAARVMELTGFPIDNIIPYNVARAVIARMDPRGLEVVPDWNFSDRGPLAGILAAGFAIITGTRDDGPWLVPASPQFFYFEALLIFLNSFSLFAMLSIAERCGGRRSAIAGLLLLASSYTIFQNMIFTWPKLFMAYFLVAGLLLITERRFVIAGLFLSLSYTAHNSAVFPVVAIVAALLIQSCRATAKPRASVGLQGASLLLGFFPIYAVWRLFRLVWAPESTRLLYLQLFCYQGADAGRIPPLAALDIYFHDHSLRDIFFTRLNNLWYPFDFFTGLPAVLANWSRPTVLARGLSYVVPYQFVYGIGLFTCVLAILGLLSLRRDRATEVLRLFVYVGVGAIIPTAAVLGCPLSTWIHHWAYLGLLATGAFAGAAAVRIRYLGAVLFAAAVASNLFLLIEIHYVQRGAGTTALGANSFTNDALLLAVLLTTSAWFFVRSPGTFEAQPL